MTIAPQFNHRLQSASASFNLPKVTGSTVNGVQLSAANQHLLTQQPPGEYHIKGQLKTH